MVGNNIDPEKIQISPHQALIQDYLNIGPHLGHGQFFNLAQQVERPLILNLSNANPTYVPFGETLQELESLDLISKVAAQNKCGNTKNKNYFSLNEIMSQILTKETTLNLNNYDMYTSVDGVVGALLDVLNTIITPQKDKIIISTPNWKFDVLISNYLDSPSRIAPIFAVDADSYVDGILNTIDDETAAIIIVDPGNPIPFELSQVHVDAIEQASEHFGIVPIFDDVYRGTRPYGERNSSSQYSRSSIIIESNTKRFGPRGVGAAYTLVPKHLDLKLDLNVSCLGCEQVAAVITRELYQNQYGDKLASRNQKNFEAMTMGIASMNSSQEINLTTLYDGSPLSMLLLPDGENSGIAFQTYLENNFIAAGLGVDYLNPSLEWYQHNGFNIDPVELKLGLNYMRFALTRIEPEQAFHVGRKIGEFYK